MHKFIVIGIMGLKRVYIDIPKKDAMLRYLIFQIDDCSGQEKQIEKYKAYSEEELEQEITQGLGDCIAELDIENEFEVYDIENLG